MYNESHAVNAADSDTKRDTVKKSRENFNIIFSKLPKGNIYLIEIG